MKLFRLNKTNLHIWYIVHKTTLFVLLAVFLLGLGIGLFKVFYKSSPYVSPVPPTILTQVDFKVIYPKSYDIDTTSWKYIKDEETLSFTVEYGDNSIVFTEQAVPLAYIDDAAAYDRFIGSLKPYINFKVPLGNVSLVSFVTAGDYKPEGKSGILKSNGTLVIAKPQKDLTDKQWQNLFNSLTAN